MVNPRTGQSFGRKAPSLIQAHFPAISDSKNQRSALQELSQFRSGYDGHLRGLISLTDDVMDFMYDVSAGDEIHELTTILHDNRNRDRTFEINKKV